MTTTDLLIISAITLALIFIIGSIIRGIQGELEYKKWRKGND